MKILLVSGATGEIGSALIDRLRQESWTVRVLSRRSQLPFSLPPGWEVVRGDLRDRASLRRATEGVAVVLHLAAVTHTNHRRLYYEINWKGTEHLLAAAAEAKVNRFVFLSTRAVGKAGGAYSHSKELAENSVQKSGLPWVIFRPAEVYGPSGRDSISALASFVRRWKWSPVIGDGRYTLSPVHVADVVEAVVRGVKSPRAEGRIYTLAGPEEVTLNDLIDLIAQALGVRRRKVHLPLGLAKGLLLLGAAIGKGPARDQIPRLLLPKSSDSSAAVADLGYCPRSLKESLGLLGGKLPESVRE